jgi:hypothetical protein
MKTNQNSKRWSAGWRPFLGVLLAACFLATAAHAESLYTGKFTLPHEVRWDNAVLTPGQYLLELDHATNTLVIRNASTGKIAARVPANADYYEADHAGSEVLIIRRGNQRAVSGVRLEGFGNVFEKAHPFPANERAIEEEARNAEAIPVETAQK